MPEAWKTIVPEGKEVIDDLSIVGGKIYVKRLKDVKSETIDLHARRQAGRQHRLRWHRLRFESVGRTTDRYGFFQLRVVHRSRPRFIASIQ